MKSWDIGYAIHAPSMCNPCEIDAIYAESAQSTQNWHNPCPIHGKSAQSIRTPGTISAIHAKSRQYTIDAIHAKSAQSSRSKSQPKLTALSTASSRNRFVGHRTFEDKSFSSSIKKQLNASIIMRYIVLIAN